MEKKRPLISVIVPVYNVMKFLPLCLDSLVMQSYENIEVLLIDDGSTDNSGIICDEYAKKDSRFKVFHKENGGVSSARNMGLDNAKGDFVSFVDSDDSVATDYLELLYNDMIKHNADVVCCNFAILDEFGNRLNNHSRDKNGVCPNIKSDRLIRDNNLIFADIKNRQELYFTHAIAKLIRASFIKKYRFPKMKFSEDTVYMFDIFTMNPTVYLSTYAGYNYVLSLSSATRSAKKYNLQHPRDTVTLSYHQYCYFEKDNLFFVPYLNIYADALYYYAYNAAQRCNKSERKGCRVEILKSIKPITQNKSDISKGLWLKLRLYMSAPWLFTIYAQMNELIRG